MEQQSALALEDAELQKAAIETESETKANEIRLELETARTVSPPVERLATLSPKMLHIVDSTANYILYCIYKLYIIG